VPPTTTLQAAVNLARNPGANVAPLFALGEVTKAYAPSLTPAQGPESTDALQKLDAWTLAVKFNAAGGDASCQFGGPGNLVFDAGGYAWVTINTVQGTPNSAQCIVVLKPDGSPADGADGTVRSPVTGGGVVGGGIGVTVDTAGRIWAGNFGWGNLIPTPGSVSLFTRTGAPLSPSPMGYIGGTYRVQGTVADAQNNIWIASWGNNAVVLFPNGNSASGFAPYVDNNQKPFGVAVARDGSAWVSYQGTSTLSKFTIGSNALVKQFNVPVGTDGNPKGVALDTQGNAWVVSGKTSLVHAFRPDGSLLLPPLSGRGFNGPWGLSVDAKDRVWIANFGDEDNVSTRYSLVELCGVTTANCPPGFKTGDAISPPSGWTLPSAGSQVLLNNGQPLYPPPNPPSYKPLMRLTNAQTDMAGNVWVTNNWKPSVVVDIGGIPADPNGNPGGDGIVVFVGLAAPTLSPNVGQPLPP
jgi:sugar lactone lactonase YvrE